MTLPPTCDFAFKEWAAVCEALAAGRQTIILRKGGLRDEIEKIRFAAGHGFWLYPTNYHQRAEDLTADAGQFIQRAAAARPPPGLVAVKLFAKLQWLDGLTTEERALRLAGLHIWSEDTVRQRFAYRFPQLFLLGVQIYSRPEAILIPESPEMAGCKSWLTLPQPISTAGLTPVLTLQQVVDQGRVINAALA